MKKNKMYFRFFGLLVLLAVSQAVFAQTTFKDFFNEQTPLTYLGVDFTDVKIAGQTDFDIKDLKDRHFSTINNLVLSEAKKYDMSKFFHRSNVLTDISLAEAHNSKIDADKIKSPGGDDENRFTEASIAKLVKGYSFGGKKGIGVLLIAESLSKIKVAGTIHVVFIDMSNSKVLYTEKFMEKAGGIGLRNYYAKVVYNTLNEIGDSKYNNWKKANGL